MSLVQHKKISGLANTDPDLVGGDDWDDNHVFPVGSVFLFGFAEILFNSTSASINERSDTIGASIGWASGAGSKYRLTLTLDTTKIPIRPPVSGKWWPHAMFEYVCDAYPAKKLRMESYNWTTGNVVFVLDNVLGNGTSHFGTSPVIVMAAIYLRVTA